MAELYPEDDFEYEHRPKKRAKTHEDQNGHRATLETQIPADNPKSSLAHAEAAQTEKEKAVGIEAFVSNNAGFSGILKWRYHDFLVNEIMPDGRVVHFDETRMLEPPPAPIEEGSQPGNAPEAMHIESEKPEQEQLPNMQDKEDSIDDLTKGQRDRINALAQAVGADGKMPTALQLSSDSFSQLQRFFSEEGIEKLAGVYNSISLYPHKAQSAHGSVDSQPIDEKDDRKLIHILIRTVFSGRLETTHTEGNIIRCAASASVSSRKGKNNQKKQKKAFQPNDWERLGGNYMHFTLYKENRDSHDVLGFLASRMQMRNQKIFDTAGNKDRRGVTVQRVSAYRMKAERFLGLNNSINFAYVGDCSYHPYKLQLGDLVGNEFIITLRNCIVRLPGEDTNSNDLNRIEQLIQTNMNDLRSKGFINYYGLQRFGAFAARTDTVGKKMVNGDYKAAVDDILQYSAEALEAVTVEDQQLVSSDDRRRARALHWFATKSKDIDTILDTLPRRFISECAIVKFLGKTRAKDQGEPYWRGALEAIPRASRTLYPHAYQSLIWNLAATHRWNLAPGSLLPGDLVLVSESEQDPTALQTSKVDDQGDPIYEPSDEPSEAKSSDAALKVYELTEDDIAAGKYTIFDVVLPQPGFDIKYPRYMLDYYKEAMSAHGGIDPLNMRRSWRDVSLPGTYRKLLGRPGEDFGVEVLNYDDPEVTIAITDWEKLEAKRNQQRTSQGGNQNDTPQNAAAGKMETSTPEISIGSSGIALAKDIPRGERLAVVLKFQLPSSTYATMALRELMKPGPIEFKPEFSSGRGL